MSIFFSFKSLFKSSKERPTKKAAWLGNHSELVPKSRNWLSREGGRGCGSAPDSCRPPPAWAVCVLHHGAAREQNIGEVKQMHHAARKFVRVCTDGEVESLLPDEQQHFLRTSMGINTPVSYLLNYYTQEQTLQLVNYKLQNSFFLLPPIHPFTN